MRTKILVTNLIALSLVCSSWGLFGFHSGDIEKLPKNNNAAGIINQDALFTVDGPQAGHVLFAQLSAPLQQSAVFNEEKQAISTNHFIVIAEIDTKNQTMTVRRNGETLHVWKISSGRQGYATPPGVYRPQRMHKMWRSKIYDNAPMPYAIFFHRGYAIHGTTALGRLGGRASHGCVRLDPENAKKLYMLVLEAGINNTRIIVQ